MKRIGYGGGRRAMWFLSPREKIERMLASTPRVSLAELDEAMLARVVGRAGKLDEVLEAPVTGRPCVYYEVTIEETLLGVKRRLAHEERAVMFVLEDGTGHAIVDPSRSIVDLEVDGKEESGYVDVPNARENALLTRFGIERIGLLQRLAVPSLKGFPAALPADRVPADRIFLYREAIIEVGDTIAILGSGVREPDPDGAPAAGYRGPPTTRLRMTSSRKRPMIISDKPATTL